MNINGTRVVIQIPTWRYCDEPPPPSAAVSRDVCDRCGSSSLIKVKGCVRCEACGFKGDCNGW